MPGATLYDDSSRERLVEEPPKRVAAPERTPFERDRARVVHAASFRRLAAKTQVVGPQTDDFVRNRLTHSLEVAQIARDLARALGCEPDLVETAALAHDLGHPPFGHLGEAVLDRLARARLQLSDGFEGNAQSYRIVTSTEIRGSGMIGLNLTAAVRAALLKYPWTRRSFPQPHPSTLRPVPRGATAPPDDPGSGSAKFGAYTTELADLRHAREPFAGRLPDWQQTVEASIMDTADDIAYAIHDVEDFHRVGVLQSGAVGAELRTWLREASTLAKLSEDELVAGSRRPGYATERLRRDIRRKDTWISDDEAFAAAVGQVSVELVDGLLATPFDGSIEAEQAVTSFSTRWTRRLVDAIEVLAEPTVRSGHVVLGSAQWHEVQVLKLVHRRFVLARPDLALHQRGQARLLGTLVESLLAWLTDPDESARIPQRLRDLIDLAEAELTTIEVTGAPAATTRLARARGRAIVDFVAALTDSQAAALLDAISGSSGQLWTDAFVL
jgi:dGTPase